LFKPLLLSRVLVLTVASELAAQKEDVKGPGTFLPRLIDALWDITPEQVQQLSRITVKY
jgi:thiamine-phosphate diphosphorylase/hydroxyethylthiazole kinase